MVSLRETRAEVNELVKRSERTSEAGREASIVALVLGVRRQEAPSERDGRGKVVERNGTGAKRDPKELG